MIMIDLVMMRKKKKRRRKGGVHKQGGELVLGEMATFRLGLGVLGGQACGNVLRRIIGPLTLAELPWRRMYRCHPQRPMT